jgi:ElaB/YqjD/DUF883 family membrane-anchored ribosome-binding protein
MDVASEQMKSKADEMSKNLGEKAHKAVDKAQEKFDTMRESAADMYDKGVERAGEFQDNVEEYVREQPFKSLIIAAGAGLLIGMFLSRR